MTYSRGLVLPRTRFPVGVKIVGVAITVNPNEQANASPWLALQADWQSTAPNTGWNNWVKKQIDIAQATFTNLNTVTMVGCPNLTVGGTSVTLNQYLQNWSQLAAYCLSKGFYLIARISDRYPGHVAGASNASIQALILALTKTLHAFPNVIAIDIDTELDVALSPIGGTAFNAAVAADLTTIAAMRLITDIPITVSGVAGSESNATWLSSWAGFIDFWSFDEYQDLFLTTWNIFTQTRPGEKFLIMEFGQNQSASTGARQSRYSSVLQYGMRRPECLGAIAFAVGDQDFNTNPSNEWGLFDSTWTYRADMGNILKRYPPRDGIPFIFQLQPTSSFAVPSGVGWYALPGAPVQNVSIGRACRVEIFMQADIEVKVAGNIYAVGVAIDNATPSANDPEVNFGNDGVTGRTVNAARIESLGNNSAGTQDLTPGNHSFQLICAHAGGSDNTGIVYGGPNTNCIIYLHPL